LVLQLLQDSGAASDDELFWIHTLMGCVLSDLGERSESEVHLAIAHRLWNREQQLSDMYRPWIAHYHRFFHAINLTHLGHVDTALAVARDAVAVARQSRDPLAITIALVFAATCSVRLRDPAGAASFADEAMAKAKNHGFASWESRARSLLGWVSAWQSGARVGVSEIREGIASIRSGGDERSVPACLCLLSEAELATGDPNAAAEAANDALRWGETFTISTL
jgi:hypothetical protein